MCSSKEEGKEEKWERKTIKKEMDNKRIFMTSHMTLSAYPKKINLIAI